MMELVGGLRAWNEIAGVVLACFVALMSLRVAWEAHKAPAESKTRLIVASVGLLATAPTLLPQSWGWWPVVMTMGWIGLALVTPRHARWISRTGLMACVVGVGAGVVGLTLGYTPVMSIGPSMWPTAPKGTSMHVLAFRAYSAASPSYGDDIQFGAAPDGDQWPSGNYRKRVWALPGDLIRVTGSSVWLNNQQIADCSDRSRPIGPRVWWCTVTWPNGATRDVVWGWENTLWPSTIRQLKEGQVFVVGDNTVESTDSRERGPIELQWIDGQFHTPQPPSDTPWVPWLGAVSQPFSDDRGMA